MGKGYVLLFDDLAFDLKTLYWLIFFSIIAVGDSVAEDEVVGEVETDKVLSIKHMASF